MTKTDNETRFAELKAEILRRAKEAHACAQEYGRAYGADTLAGLLEVVKANFIWATCNGVIDADLIGKYRGEFARNEIFCNEDVVSGYLLCDGASVEAYGSATVVARGHAIVRAFDRTYIVALGHATVTAHDHAGVTAFDRATVYSYSDTPCVHRGDAVLRTRGAGKGGAR